MGAVVSNPIKSCCSKTDDTYEIINELEMQSKRKKRVTSALRGYQARAYHTRLKSQSSPEQEQTSDVWKELTDQTYEHVEGYKTDDGTYDGQMVNGVRWGLGRMTWTNGDVYYGYFANDLYDGHGEFTKHDPEETYKGEWVAGQMHGTGLFRTAKYEYRGGFAHGLCEGEGVERWIEGQEYSGSYKAGLRHGQGTAVFKGGKKYTGGFAEGKMHGHGTYRTTHTTYEGGFTNNKRNGQGTFTCDRYVYTGTFAEGKYDGQGTMTFKDGTHVRGEWRAGKKNGLFEVTEPNGVVRTCEWLDGTQGRWLS